MIQDAQKLAPSSYLVVQQLGFHLNSSDLKSHLEATPKKQNYNQVTLLPTSKDKSRKRSTNFLQFILYVFNFFSSQKELPHFIISVKISAAHTELIPVLSTGSNFFCYNC